MNPVLWQGNHFQTYFIVNKSTRCNKEKIMGNKSTRCNEENENKQNNS